MASFFQYLLLLLFFIAYFSSSAQSSSRPKSSFRPRALVLPVTKNASTLQYVTQIHQRTPLVPLNLVLDLGGQNLWVDCEKHYTSSTYRPARCNSTQCSLADASTCGECNEPPRPGCHNSTCTLDSQEPHTGGFATGDVGQDVVSVQSTNGFHPGRNVAVSRFIFSCTPSYILQGLADGVSGMAGLGRTKIALPSQFASTFCFPRKFAICLPSSGSKGVVFFGDSPYVFLPNVNAAQSLTYTPFIFNRSSSVPMFAKRQFLSEYYIGVKSIKIDQKVVPNINKILLPADKEGFGGTTISTLYPYTILKTSIFKAVTKVFIKASAAWNITRVAGVAPFEVCFSKDNIGSTRLGPAVPTIELVLVNNVGWPIFGANSMVPVKDDVLCLGVLDGGEFLEKSIMMGTYQLENNLLQFDLDSSRLGFSSLLFGRKTSCANFNFTSATAE
ncbi:hypothetical protein QN277_019897 [Acacia crassicarpa]|uniref:Peptidase A1 domain-containing protein n=2 Tax=Acacia crassicarpa TaxID=499986 RepID=A0AAE1MRK6_9FABA|nr:hypothetical protein QN277_019897 [Acacia crassicarpa]